jgi:DNA-binding NarL/FixJ family response regulator
MMDDVPILIVAKTGRWRDSLQVLLRAIEGIELLPPTDSLASALPLIARHASMVVVLDFSLPGDEAWSLLQHMKQNYPQARCLALIESEAQKQLVQAAGADNVLLAGFTLEMLQTALAQILENLQVERFIEGWLARSRQEAQIIARAMVDSAYRQALLANPRALLEKEIGLALPETLRIIVHEETPSSWHIVLPAAVTHELSDEAMDQVAGGLDSFSFASIAAITDTFKLAGDKW